ncbi:hypothetical protein P364_0119615 [Paenibacillus sp. MAEPY2]|nr:hypothetical protein P364_0119615 [Paenibacillus sp. MAEPY2]
MVQTVRDRTFQTLAWNETINRGIISGRSLTGHAHGNAFSFYSFLIRLRRVHTALITMGIMPGRSGS